MHKYLPGVDFSDVARYSLESSESMVWKTLKTSAQLVKRGLFCICNKGSKALFWVDSWDGHPPLLSMYPHLQALCDYFIAVGWDKVEHYKTGQYYGLVVEGFFRLASRRVREGSD